MVENRFINDGGKGEKSDGVVLFFMGLVILLYEMY